MALRLLPRRPKTRNLQKLYDAGVEAAESGARSPYKPFKARGDETRHWLWKQGLEDGQVRQAIRELV